jgi:hypothetical protein
MERNSFFYNWLFGKNGQLGGSRACGLRYLFPSILCLSFAVMVWLGIATMWHYKPRIAAAKQELRVLFTNLVGKSTPTENGTLP